MPDPTTTSPSPISSDSLDSDPIVAAAIAANPKSALATTEFFALMFFNLVTSMKAVGLIAAGGVVAQYIAFVTMALTNGIFIWARTSLKKTHVTAAAIVASAAVAPQSSSVAVQKVTPPAAP